MIKLRKIKKEEKEKAYNINQKYLYEMTNYYPDELDNNGNLSYGYFDKYFEEETRFPYFIYNDDTLVGFLFINKISYFDLEIDYSLAEFTIFPAYRGNGFSKLAMNEVFKIYKGIWEIKYNVNNIKAKNLWESITKCYNPERLKYSDIEIVLRFNN